MTSAALCAGLLILGSPCPQSEGPSFSWRRVQDVREAGWSAEGLETFHEKTRQAGTASYMVIENARVIAFDGDVAHKYRCHSIRKSLLSGMIGMHVRKGTIDLSRSMKDLGIDDVHGLTDQEKTARVQDLLRARSGVYHPAAYESRSMKDKGKPDRDEHKPGTFFLYNNWDFNVLGHIFRDLTKSDIFEEFDRLFAKPLGMEDFSPVDCRYVYEKELSKYPAYAFRMSTRDLARFGLLYLRDGRWDGEQHLPKAWIRDSFTRHSPGYGYMWWISRVEGHDAYSASGSGGHKLVIYPRYDLIFVHRMDTDRRQRVRGRVVWDLFRTLLRARTGKGKTNPRTAPLDP